MASQEENAENENLTDDQPDIGINIEEDVLNQRVQSVAQARNPFLNASQLKLQHVPDALLNLTFLQYLYMGFNSLESLPDSLFTCLPNVKWLDLRCNQLSFLPNADLSHHQNLGYLLLEKNNIQRLPIELGQVSSLRGVSLSDNPLEFPHSEIVAEGTEAMLRYLREVQEGRQQIEQRLAMDSVANEVASPRSADEEELQQQQQQQQELAPLMTNGRHQQQDAEAAEQQLAANAQMARLHKPQAAAHSQIRQQHLQQHRQKQAAAAAAAAAAAGSNRAITKQSEKHAMYVNANPEPPPLSRIEQRATEERRQAKRKNSLNKQEAVLQRRRDAEATRQWKEEAKLQQMKKAREQMQKSAQAIEAESGARIAAAPFNAAWDPELLQLPSAAEREQRKWQGEVPLEPKPLPMTHEQLREMEILRRRKEAEITQQIHQHSHNILLKKQQQQQQQQQLSPAEQVAAARRDVEILQNLRRTLFSASGRLAVLQ